jgi:uncharacterized protein (DUF779 family)
MRYSHTRPASLALLIAALLAVGSVEARSNAQTADTGAQMSEPAPDRATGANDVTTGAIDLTPAEKRKKQFEDCMAIWDPSTHMTKKQWRRTCNNTTEDELPNL